MTHSGNWSPYAGSSPIILAVVLLLVTGVLIFLAMRLHHPLAVKRPELSSFAMLTFSPVMKLSRYTLFLLAGMFVVFAVWAVFGFAYPAAPLPIALNMMSKLLAFTAAVSLFLSPETSAVGNDDTKENGKALLPNERKSYEAHL